MAITPTRATYLSIGYDLYSVEDTILYKQNRQTISTHLIIEIPEDTYGRIASRSGLSLYYGIEVGAGVIDSDYRGEIKYSYIIIQIKTFI